MNDNTPNHIIKIIGDDRGVLSVIDFANLPFIPQRMFYIRYVPDGTIRGQHAHKKCSQIFIHISGTIDITVKEINGSISCNRMKELSPSYIIVEPMEWVELKFIGVNGCILVLCSHPYDEDDYIRDFNEFKKMTNGSNL